MTEASERARISQNIRDMRKDLGLTQTEAAALAGPGQSWWWEMEHGRKNWTIARLRTVAVALNCTIVDLLSDVPRGTRGDEGAK